MKIIISILSIAFIFPAFLACAKDSGDLKPQNPSSFNAISYNSRKGQNYLNGSIVTLPVGNTEVAAKIAQEITGGNIFEICTVKTVSD